MDGYLHQIRYPLGLAPKRHPDAGLIEERIDIAQVRRGRTKP